MNLNQKYINEIVAHALKEDLYPRGDITSNLLNNNLKITAKIICNQNAIIAGIKFAKTAFKLIALFFANFLPEAAVTARVCQFFRPEIIISSPGGIRFWCFWFTRDFLN